MPIDATAIVHVLELQFNDIPAVKAEYYNS